MTLYEYIQAYKTYFWEWQDNGEVIEIPGGSTIAYTKLVKELLEGLAEQGFPPFGSLLLAIIATNDTAQNSLKQIQDDITTWLINESQLKADNAKLIEEAFDFLGKLAGLQPRYKSGKGRMLLFQTLFRNCHNMVSVIKARKALYIFQELLSVNKIFKTAPLHAGIFARDFKTIALLNRQYPTRQAIIARMAEMPELEIKELEEELTQQAEEKDFVDQLVEDPATFRIGSLVKPIWAGLKIPIDTAAPSEQQFGGISDLTNKGDFDKLLTSEFAYDDLTFLSRLANNEALYLHREMPPAVDDRQRILLTDISLLSWGTPKVLAFAAAIAITRHPKAKKESLSFTVGNTYKPVDLETVETVIDGLQLTDSCLHPAKGIDLFLKEYASLHKTEIFLLITPEALQQYAVQKVLSEYTGLFRYIITVDREGHIAFYRFRQGGRKLLQEIKLPLEQLWTQAPLKKEDSTPRRIPLVEYNYPILFPGPQRIRAVLETSDGGVYYVSDSKLYMRAANGIHQTTRAFIILAHQLPETGTFYIGNAGNDEVWLLNFKEQDKELTLTELKDRDTVKRTFYEWQKTATDFFFHRDGFYHINDKGCYRISYNEGDIAIDAVHSGIKELVLARDEQAKRKPTGTQRVRSVLKNVHSVFINTSGNLVFNQHELNIKNGTISINTSNRTVEHITAKATKDSNVFEFPEKSTVMINPLGMLVLKSSNVSIPIIYIPSVLAASLGLVAGEHFTGNQYYFRNDARRTKDDYSVMLLDAGIESREVMKILVQEGGWDLESAEEIASRGSGKIGERLDRKKALTLMNRLIAKGAKCKMEEGVQDTPGRQITIIREEEFNKLYLQAFIQNIYKHATPGKTAA